MAISRTYIGKARYNFDVDGGAIGAITPADNFTLPAGSVILGAVTDIQTTIASGGSATIALALGGVTIKAATAFDDAAFVGTDAQLARTTMNKTSSTGSVTVTVAVADLTDGVMDIYVEYMLPVA